eukprot:COSAG06_NODE_2654_length_6488_cov_4.182658_8_plen_41_part_01
MLQSCREPLEVEGEVLTLKGIEAAAEAAVVSGKRTGGAGPS